MNRTLATLALFAVAWLAPLALVACGSPDDAADLEEAPTEEALTSRALVTGFYQNDSGGSVARDVTTIMLAPTGQFWLNRCTDTPCSASEAQSGTYKLYRTANGSRYVHLLDGNGKLLDRYNYKMSGVTLKLRRVYSSRWMALDVMSEDLCDSSGGSWTDDDFTATGLNCVCPDGQSWGPKGCHAAN